MVYTAALVVIIGAGDGEKGTQREARSPLERTVATLVERADVKVAEAGDVSAFRKPKVTGINCVPDSCAVAYAIGLPGAGRIREDQTRFLDDVFGKTEVQRIRLRVYRNTVVGPQRNLKKEEEAPAGTPLLDNTCDEAKVPNTRWTVRRDAVDALNVACDTQRYSPTSPTPQKLEPPGPQPDDKPGR